VGDVGTTTSIDSTVNVSTGIGNGGLS